MASLVTKKGNPAKPPRVLIYGVEGVGKSTFGARAPNPVFISPEGGTDLLRSASGEGVDEMPNVGDWDSLNRALDAILVQPHGFKTLVIDSADWVEKLAHQKIVGNSGKSVTTVNGGYGAGFGQSELMHKDLIEKLAQIRDKRNMGIVITAHAHVKPVKDPSMMEDYDQFEIKCHEKVSSLWREWVDALFFVRFRTFIKTSEDTKARAVSDGTRVLYTVKQPSFQAKNRYGMLPEYDFTEEFHGHFIAHVNSISAVEAKKLSLDEMRVEMNEMWLKITDEALKKKVQESVEAAGGDIEKLRPLHARLKEITK